MPQASIRKRITTPRELAAGMARLAQGFRDSVAQDLAGDGPSDFVIDLRNAYASARMPELAEVAKAEQFADVFAQTLVYGLFALRCAHPAGQFRRRAAKVALPVSDPFLCRLLETLTPPEFDREPYAGFFHSLLQLLENTNLHGVLEPLGGRGLGPDPIEHFYETFLAAYNPQLRRACGVYYTPGPVVSFIVRAVDDLLKNGFRIRNGLAEHKMPPRVFILDPACGTGNFLCGVIGHVRNVYASRKASLRTWSGYARSCLLPRLHGFEMLPVPYAIAHLQLDRLTGHDRPVGRLRDRGFPSNGQPNVRLTNTFDEVVERAEQLLECLNNTQAPTNANRQPPILVVLGNPPYRGISADGGGQIGRLLEDYRRVNGAPLGEKKVWLKNDYVQFIRLSQWCIERTGRGILGFITDHSYLDSPTFRGMRQQLLKTFHEIYLLNLHGNAKRRERAPDGGKDDNIFDIKQGVAIALFVRKGKDDTVRRVFYEDLWGSRQAKFDRLAATSLETMRWRRLSPALPGFEFVPVNRKAQAEYQRYWPVKDIFAAGSDHEIFPVGSNGVQTSRDHLVVGFSRDGLRERLKSFLAPEKTDQQIRREFFGDKSVGNYRPGDTRQWQLGKARNSLRQTPSWYRAITPYLYRPFDQRFLLYLDSMIDWPRPEVMRHLQQPNYALCIGRAGLVNSGTWDLVFCVNQLCDHNLFYRGSSINFPLYLHSNGETGPLPNLSARFVERITKILGLRLLADKPGDLRRTIGPENILHYGYAVLHSPTYRRRYAEFLKYDFPRLPLTADKGLFRSLCRRGEQLVRLHLLQKVPPTSATYPIKGDDIVREVCYLEDSCVSQNTDRRGRVWINSTQYFEGVAPEVWQFHIGGYRICQKWLKDRKGRGLSHSEQACYCRIIGAITKSIRLVHEIDAVIEEHGGWPIR